MYHENGRGNSPGHLSCFLQYKTAGEPGKTMTTQRENIILIRNFVVKCFSYKRYQTFKILTMSIKNNHLKLDTTLKLSHSGNNKLFSARLQHYLKILSTTQIFWRKAKAHPRESMISQTKINQLKCSTFNT